MHAPFTAIRLTVVLLGLALCAATPSAVAVTEDAPAEATAEATSEVTADAAPAPVAATSPEIVAPTVTHHVIAKFPVSGRNRKQEEEGMRMIMSVEVDAKGKPGRVGIVDTNLGSAYRRPALQALSHWRFSPATQDGMPVATTILVPMMFGYGDNDMSGGEGRDTAIRAPGQGAPRVIIAPRNF